jgi:hypothetical protein
MSESTRFSVNLEGGREQSYISCLFSFFLKLHTLQKDIRRTLNVSLRNIKSRGERHTVIICMHSAFSRFMEEAEKQATHSLLS